MSPEAAELIEEIEAERGRVRVVLEEADADLRQAEKVSEELSGELDESPEEAEAVETLRRAFG